MPVQKKSGNLLNALHILIKEKKISEISNFLVFLRIFFLENYDLTMTMGTLTTIIKENNHFLCVLKPWKFHENLWQ